MASVCPVWDAAPGRADGSLISFVLSFGNELNWPQACDLAVPANFGISPQIRTKAFTLATPAFPDRPTNHVADEVAVRRRILLCAQKCPSRCPYPLPQL